MSDHCIGAVIAGAHRWVCCGIDHPDIELFIAAKQNSDKLTGFNVSVGVTDEFMQHLKTGEPFPLRFEGKVYKEVDPRNLWNQIMRRNFEYAEPGVLFLDRINSMNNLHYLETIEATNPCGEQPLPANGACLLGSFNLVKYVDLVEQKFDWDKYRADIRVVVRRWTTPSIGQPTRWKHQKQEALFKRRMGLGITGLANAGEMMGHPYASDGFMQFMEMILRNLRDTAYDESAELAKEKGPCPAWQWEEYSQGKFILQLPPEIQHKINTTGIRNSHLTSIAPTGTISLTADNVSSGIEPPFALYYDRTIEGFDGQSVERVEDYAYSLGIKGRTANEISAEDHVKVLSLAAQYVDSAVSKHATSEMM